MFFLKKGYIFPGICHKLRRSACELQCPVDTGMLASGGAQFGDITVLNSGSSQSFIARYVDTAFMHPYVRPGSRPPHHITPAEKE